MSRFAPCFVFLLCLLSVGALTGCHDAPSVFRAVDIDTPGERSRVSSMYWKRFDIPSDYRLENQRVVVTEFVVEFVTEKRESTRLISDRQSMVHVPAGLVGVGLQATGLNRKVLDFPEDVFVELPEELYEAFEATLEARGCTVIDAERVRAAAAYREIEGAGDEETPFLQRINPMGSDTGRVIKAVFHPARDLRLLPVGEAMVEASEVKLLDELDADISVRVRFRVGLFDGRPSLERGTMLLVTGPRVLGSLVTERSLLSAREVVDEEATEFVPVKGEVLAIEGEQYMHAVRELFPHFIAMGLECRDQDDLTMN